MTDVDKITKMTKALEQVRWLAQNGVVHPEASTNYYIEREVNECLAKVNCS